ncbi:MAG: hypothetical protein KKE30_00490 [Gammaproteobacteria bacterium]|nr:hypothetical protein [Gammaproteobacteria bacterium]MBU1553198.1 hypothetical protein [Gammaproteobacteria bacterium]MBU2069635.1 hypothetical protein [Gammaproteobacteria bacterium]MBU2184500.1 hypothetical protein [Gammaproteobacteria bacterium]MBU2205182.1 hypothetical protein [Gammaproteobacteria bacterium]
MSTPEQFDRELRQQYQHDKALHPLPQQVHRAIRQATARQRAAGKARNWRFSWRSAQLAVCSALLLVMAYLLQLPQPVTTQYYQVLLSHNEQYRQVQQHSVSTQVAADTNATEYQHYIASTQHTEQFHRQIGLLRQQQQEWQISVCNDLLLTIDTQLLAQLAMPKAVRQPQPPQWVEFISNSRGQLVAIQPATQALLCPHS